MGAKSETGVLPLNETYLELPGLSPYTHPRVSNISHNPAVATGKVSTAPEESRSTDPNESRSASWPY